MSEDMNTKKIIKSGYPCKHKGCLHHVTKPCEGCGRIAGRGDAEIPILQYTPHQRANVTKEADDE